jgi:hypothetical protein
VTISNKTGSGTHVYTYFLTFLRPSLKLYPNGRRVDDENSGSHVSTYLLTFEGPSLRL